VTFRDSVGDTVTVDASAGVADLGTFVSGTVTSTVLVTDVAGNTATASGAAIALDAVDGSSGNDTIVGTAGNDTFYGLAGDDIIKGLDGDDALYGGTGNDRLSGGTGADAMSGGTGNDTYYVDNAGDQIIEASGGGTDNVWASADWTMAANQE